MSTPLSSTGLGTAGLTLHRELLVQHEIEFDHVDPWLTEEAKRATVGVLGDDLTDLYTEFKRDEWARFCGAVTDWEDMMYRQWIP